MKKSTTTLALRRETLRLLTEIDLVCVAGGNADTGGVNNACALVKNAPMMDTEGPNSTCIEAQLRPATP